VRQQLHHTPSHALASTAHALYKPAHNSCPGYPHQRRHVSYPCSRCHSVQWMMLTSASVNTWGCAPGAAPAQQCCCFGCCRYSPNLSKRTTHLVTPHVVGSLSDKLAAAAAAGSRFNAHIVSIGWVEACAASKGKAAEVLYAPALPGGRQVSRACSIEQQQLCCCCNSSIAVAATTARTASATISLDWLH
jgi:hypothetical protein